DPHRYACRCRGLELYILGLEGAAPEILWAARSQLTNSRCHGKALPPIPTLEDAIAIIEKGEVYYADRPECLGDRRAGPAYQAPQERVRTENVPEVWAPSEPVMVRRPSKTAPALLDHEKQDKLADYRDQGRIQTEPSHV